jgi:hypothetical protein
MYLLQVINFSCILLKKLNYYKFVNLIAKEIHINYKTYLETSISILICISYYEEHCGR